MKLTIDMLNGGDIPRRGDLVQTNVGNKRERTCFVLRSRALKPINGVPRASLWVERWWELEPEFRMKLFRSAERRGGQKYIRYHGYRAKKKKQAFEAYMRGEIHGGSRIKFYESP